MATSPGSYKGIVIKPGTDAEVAAQVAAINAAQSAPLSGTGTPSPSGLPTGGTPAPTEELPNTGGKKSPLLSFADSLNAAVNLARKSRNASSLEMMMPFQGTVMASDFNSILDNLNTASDRTSSDLIKRATETSKILSVSDARALGVPFGTTEADAAGRGIVPKSDKADLLVRSGNLDYSRADYSDDASALEESRGSDGWVDPTVYQKLYDAWIASNGKIADFVKTFPPAQYVNPENDWLPVYLQQKKTGVALPAGWGL